MRDKVKVLEKELWDSSIGEGTFAYITCERVS